MKILLFGANGQFGSELIKNCPEGICLKAPGHSEIDFKNADSLKESIADFQPDWIINAVAYTAVDKAEEDAELADRINHKAVGIIAATAKAYDIRMLHISTDFVFDGNQTIPYKPYDLPSPISVYGKTKLAGEQAVTACLGSKTVIIRTAWLYGCHGQNFVKTMLRLMGEKDSIKVVNDQIGTPTWTRGLAITAWGAVQEGISGIFHWTDAGVTSWYDFAVAIQEEALACGLLTNKIPVYPISSAQYPTPAQRPPYSVLDTTDICRKLDLKAEHWRVQLRCMLKELI